MIPSSPQTDAVDPLHLLREETRTQHEALDDALELTSHEWTVGDYTRLLERFHGLHAPLEEALGQRDDLGLDFESRRKLPALERDLRALGGEAVPPRADGLPRLDSRAAALGCLYVLEGSTLGGQILARHFADALGLTPERGLSYHSGYGAETGQRWKEVQQLLRDGLRDPAQQGVAVKAARETFDAFHRWLVQ
jgi:heme oxygenase